MSVKHGEALLEELERRVKAQVVACVARHCGLRGRTSVRDHEKGGIGHTLRELIGSLVSRRSILLNSITIEVWLNHLELLVDSNKSIASLILDAVSSSYRYWS